MEPSFAPGFGGHGDSQDARQPIVLLVDDDDVFRTALAETLHEDGYRVQAYATPTEIPQLSLLPEVAVVITDYDMPGEDGLSFARRFHASHPKVPIIMVTAYCGMCLDGEPDAGAFISICCKPIDYESLQQLLRRRPADGVENDASAAT